MCYAGSVCLRVELCCACLSFSDFPRPLFVSTRIVVYDMSVSDSPFLFLYLPFLVLVLVLVMVLVRALQGFGQSVSGAFLALERKRDLSAYILSDTP